MTDVLTKNLLTRYESLDLLGHGGMGTVIRAYDRTLNRDVAVKQLSPGLQQNASAVEIFLTEARALATLSHLNLVNVYDIIEAPEGVAMIQEFVHGTTLEREVDGRGALPEDEVLLIALQLICVVGYLHHMNYLHRDLKPANIILQPDGFLRLVDFGLSRKFDQMLARGTEVRGTPAYMAPEQIKSRELTPATDIYQIGATLYELLVGALPFETNGDTYALAYAHVNEKPPRVQEKRPDVSRELSDIIYKCLKKKPKNRYADCQELLDDIAPLYQALCGHSIEESGYMVPFGKVGKGDVIRDGESVPNTSGRYLAVPKHVTGNRISSLDVDAMRTSNMGVERTLREDSSVSAQEFEEMEERLEELKREHRRKNRRLVALVGVLLAMVGIIATVGVVVSQRPRGEQVAEDDTTANVAAALTSPPVKTGPPSQEEARTPQSSPEPAKKPHDVETVSAEAAQTEVISPTEEERAPDAAIPVKPTTSKGAPKTHRRASPKKSTSRASAPDAEPEPVAEPQKKTGNYLDGFQKVDANDKKLDNDLKALSEDL